MTADLSSILEKPSTIAAADNRLRESAANALIVVLDLISEVEQAYSATRAAEGQIENARARQQLLRQLRDIAQKRLDAGDATRLDVLTLDSQLMQSTLDVSDLGLQQDTQRMTLARLVGMPLSDAPWQLAPWESPQQGRPPEESAWIEAAMHCRPEIAAKRWELRALGDDLKAADLAPLQGDAIGVHAEHDGSWRLGPTITIPIPIFDFGQAMRAKIEAQRIAARHELLQQRREIVQDIRLAYATYMHSMTALADARDKLLPLQRQQIEQARLAYQSGEADLATLLLAETDLQLTQSKMIDLKEKVTVAQGSSCKLLPPAGKRRWPIGWPAGRPPRRRLCPQRCRPRCWPRSPQPHTSPRCRQRNLQQDRRHEILDQYRNLRGGRHIVGDRLDLLFSQ